MFERFTDQARHALAGSQAEARALKHDWVGTEHLLLGLLRDADDLPAHVLARRGIGLAEVRAAVQEVTGERSDEPAGALPFTPRAKTVLQIALREAQELGHEHIGSGHLLLALIHDGQGVAPQVLSTLGANLDEIEHDTLQVLPGEYSDTAKTLRRRVRSPSVPAAVAEPSPGVAARLDSIDERLSDIATRLEAIERHITG